MSENNIFDKLIVMDDVPRLADKSDNFANFLAVLRKFSFTCVYIFHTMYPTRPSWQMILSQTINLIFFQALCRQPLLLRFYLLTVTDTPTNTYLTETFGNTGFTSKFQTPLKKVLDD